MLKKGLLHLSKDRQYVVYIVTTTKDNFYRIDICELGTEFHIDPARIKFSLYRKKNTYIYGDRALYNEYQDLTAVAKYTDIKLESRNYWETNKFILQEIREKGDRAHVYKLNMGKFKEEYFRDGDRYCHILLSLDIDDIIQEPINKDDYELVSKLSKNQLSELDYVPLTELKRRYNLSHIDEADYKVIESIEEGREFLKWFKESPEKLRGFDTETTTKEVDEVNLYSKDILVGIILSIGTKVSRYFPFKHDKFEVLPISFVKEIIEVVNSTEAGIVAQVIKFDEKVIKTLGYDVRLDYDSYILACLVDPTFGRGVHSLKHMMFEIQHKKYLEFEDFVISKDFTFSKVDKELAKYYACPDAPNAVIVWEDRWKKLPSIERTIAKKEMELTHVKAKQEFWGIRIDIEKLHAEYLIAKEQHKLLEELIHESIGRYGCNLNSADVLIDILYNILNCKVYLRTQGGAPSTSLKALQKLASIPAEKERDTITQDIKDTHGNLLVKASELNKVRYPQCLLLIKYKEIQKKITGFYERILKRSKNSRLFFWINQTGARTGRQSSPIHQMPKEIKGSILPDSEYHDLVAIDFSQVELRLFFSLAGETNLIELCKDPTIDIHRAVDSIISKREIWAIDAESRQRAKSTNFGVIYGISGFGLATQEYGVGATLSQRKECQERINTFYRTFKHLRAYRKRNEEIVKTNGKIRTYFGRYRYFPEIFDSEISSATKGSLIRQGMNVPIQGTAADILKIAEVNIDDYIKAKGWEKLIDTPQGKVPLVRFMLSVHDAVLISKHCSIPPEEIMIMIKECMELQIEGFAPLFTGMAFVDNWKEEKNDSYQLPIKLRDKLVENYKRTGKSVVSCKPKTTKLELLKIINDYRDNEIQEYMEGLISKYEADYKVVCQHVRHNLLTHELISRYKQDKEDALKNGKHSHLQAIEYATKCYIEERGNINKSNVVVNSDELFKTNNNDNEEIKQYFEEITKIREEFDETTGEYKEPDKDEDEVTYIFSDEEQNIYLDEVTEKVIVWEFGYAYYIDVEGLLTDDVNKVLSFIRKYYKVDGLQEIWLLYNNKLLKTPYYTDDLNIEEVTKYINNLKVNLDERGFTKCQS